jgi:hypothetical protein
MMTLHNRQSELASLCNFNGDVSRRASRRPFPVSSVALFFPRAVAGIVLSAAASPFFLAMLLLPLDDFNIELPPAFAMRSTADGLSFVQGCA